MKIIDSLPSPTLTKPRAAVAATLAALSLTGCAGGNKTFNFAAACPPRTTLEVVDLDQILPADLTMSCVDEHGNFESPIYIDEVDGERDLYEAAAPNFKMSITVNEGGGLINGWLVQGFMGATLANVEPMGGNKNPEYSISIKDVDALKGVHIARTTAQHYNVVH